MLYPCSCIISSAVRFFSRVPRSNFLQLSPKARRGLTSRHASMSMEKEKLLSLRRKQATLRIHVVSSFSTELLEVHSEEPSMHILLVPGNPGIVSFYKDFVEALYELLEGNASITAIGHICQTKKDLERGRLFSLQEQIDHKVDFIKQELQSSGLPVILVGHSIGSHICLEIFKRLPEQVKFTIGLYPFLSFNRNSLKQSVVGVISRSIILRNSFSFFLSLLGSFPASVSAALVRRLIGQPWSDTAVDAACSHLLRYHTMRNVLYMAMTEFTKLSEEPDWTFMKKKQDKIAFLFGIDDHWGPLTVYEEISKQAPGIALSIEREGHTHGYCCTKAGSIWVAHYVTALIKA